VRAFGGISLLRGNGIRRNPEESGGSVRCFPQDTNFGIPKMKCLSIMTRIRYTNSQPLENRDFFVYGLKRKENPTADEAMIWKANSLG